MKLALMELRRRPGRFVTATVILTLIAMLLMFLGGLLDGLIDAARRAPSRAQQADVIVYSDGRRRRSCGAASTPRLRAEVEAVPGRRGGRRPRPRPARRPGAGQRAARTRRRRAVRLRARARGRPRPAGPTARSTPTTSLRADGVEVGMEIQLGPARSPVDDHRLRVDTSYSGQGDAVGVDRPPGATVLAANRPDAQVADDAFQALVVRAATTSIRPTRRRRSTPRPAAATDRSPSPGAVDAIPGVAQQRSTFNQIIGVTIAIALVVVALFFALLTVERTALYGVLKALGARVRHALRRPGAAGGRRHPARGAIVAGTLGGRCSTVVIPAGIVPLDVSARAGSSRSAVAAPRRRRRRLRLLAPPGAPRRPRLRDRRRHMTTFAHASSTRPTPTIGSSLARRPARPRHGNARAADVRKVYTMADEEVVALDHADPRRGGRRDRRPRRTVGLRQDHAVLDRRRAPVADRGYVVVGGEDISELLARAAHRVPPGEGRLRVPVRQPRAVPDRSREPPRRRRARPPHRRRPHADAPTSCSRSSASRTGRRTCPRSCPADSASGSRSAGR